MKKQQVRAALTLRIDDYNKNIVNMEWEGSEPMLFDKDELKQLRDNCNKMLDYLNNKE